MKEVQEIIDQSSGAVFYAADLHVHTPASPDMDKRWTGAAADDVIQQALASGMQIIAVTDHNTAAWCDSVREAAEGTGLFVFPGVEITTSQGHLIAIFDPDKTTDAINGFLMNAAIKLAELGSDKAVTHGHNIDDVARLVEDEGGVAIAAHVDGDQGFMKMAKVGQDRMRIHGCRSIRAFEVGSPDQRDTYQGGKKQSYPRRVACIQCSDCRAEPGGMHQLDAIGARHCYLKMDEVSVEGIKQAFLDPDMRVRLTCDDRREPELVIEGAWVSGGFLQGQSFRFSDNVTCLIGGTGVGKSLTIELLRFALGQQTQVPKIKEEVDSLLSKRLGEGGKVVVLLRRFGQRYVVEREFSGWDELPTVYSRDADGVLTEVTDFDLPRLFRIDGYSQSEIIEFTREPPVRRSLIDNLLDLSGESQAIKKLKGDLRTNATAIIETQNDLVSAEEELKDRATVEADIKKLEGILSDERVSKHRLWYDEKETLDSAESALDALARSATTRLPKLAGPFVAADLSADTPNTDILDTVKKIGADVQKVLDESSQKLREGVQAAQARLAGERKTWDVRFEQAKTEYQEVLKEIDTEDIGYEALNEELMGLRRRLRELDERRNEIDTEIAPRLQTLQKERDQLLNKLQGERKAIRQKREQKAKELTDSLGHRVKIGVKADEEGADFTEALQKLKVGSYLRDDHVAQMADKTHPVPFVKHLLAAEFDRLEEKTGIDKSDFEKLREVVLEGNRLADLYELQIVDVEDRIDISLEVAGGDYRDLENLAHGQKCTVILSIAMAEGNFPLIADQPEDALHAKFIQDHIVETLRSRRGMRQYIFATRNANVLVSGDAEQVFVLDSDASQGRIERKGSIDRLTTRQLILLNLEGGKEAFALRSRKYGIEPP